MLDDHVPGCSFAPAGRKQLNLVYSLFDQGQMLRGDTMNLLARASEIMRATIVPAVSASLRDIDREIVLLLREDGVQYVNARTLRQSDHVRLVGYTYYDQGFWRALVGEALIEHGRIRPIMRALLARAMNAGCRVPQLYPRNINVWVRQLEDAFASPMVTGLRLQVEADYLAGGEYAHIGIDATIRVLRRVRGQAAASGPPHPFSF